MVTVRRDVEPSQRFETLDALRGLLALVVVLLHYDMLVWQGNETGTYVGLSAGYLAVDFFILLSGFVLAHAAYDRRGFGLWAFMLRRVARLWPLHLTMLVILSVWLLATDAWVSPSGFVLNAALLHCLGFGDVMATRFNVPSWSLSVELAANLLVGLLLLALPRGRWSNVALLALSLGALGSLWATADHLDVQNTSFLGITSLGLVRGLATFPLGIVCYRIHRARSARAGPHASRRPAIPSLEVLVFVALLGSLAAPGYTRWDLAAAPLYAVVVVLLAVPRGPIGGVLRRLRALGALSFSLYLVHFVVERVYADTVGQTLAYWPGFGVVLLVTFPVAYVAHRCVERPAYDRFKRWERGAAKGSWLRSGKAPRTPSA